MSSAFIRILHFLNTIEHIKQEDTTYFTHMKRSLGMSIRLFLGSIALGIHAFFPNKFKIHRI